MGMIEKEANDGCDRLIILWLDSAVTHIRNCTSTFLLLALRSVKSKTYLMRAVIATDTLSFMNRRLSLYISLLQYLDDLLYTRKASNSIAALVFLWIYIFLASTRQTYRASKRLSRAFITRASTPRARRNVDRFKNRPTSHWGWFHSHIK